MAERLSTTARLRVLISLQALLAVAASVFPTYLLVGNMAFTTGNDYPMGLPFPYWSWVVYGSGTHRVEIDWILTLFHLLFWLAPLFMLMMWSRWKLNTKAYG